jgi:hypothetical protein
MSVYTTIRITRGKAMALVLERLANCSDAELADWAGDVLEERMYNCRIVPDGEENDEERLA